MRKKLLFLIIFLLLTGCKAKYNLQINFGGNIIENGTIYLNNSLLGKGEYPNNSKDFLTKLSEEYHFSNNKKLSFSNSNYFGYKFYKRYHNAAYYSNQSSLIKVLFNGLSVTSDNHYVTWKTNGDNKISNYHNPMGDIPSIVEAIEINISLPYKVQKHNATRVDYDTNTYTWTFTANTIKTKGINLEYKDNELFTNNPAFLFTFVSPYVYITIFLLLVVLIVILNIVSKSRHKNRI